MDFAIRGQARRATSGKNQITPRHDHSKKDAQPRSPGASSFNRSNKKQPERLQPPSNVANVQSHVPAARPDAPYHARPDPTPSARSEPIMPLTLEEATRYAKKDVTCHYWRTTSGGCINRSCLYAHYDTKVHAPPPGSLRQASQVSGLAMDVNQNPPTTGNASRGLPVEREESTSTTSQAALKSSGMGSTFSTPSASGQTVGIPKEISDAVSYNRLSFVQPWTKLIVTSSPK